MTAGTPKTMEEAIGNAREEYRERIRKSGEPSTDLENLLIEIHVMDWLSQKFVVIGNDDVRRIWDSIASNARRGER